MNIRAVLSAAVLVLVIVLRGTSAQSEATWQEQKAFIIKAHEAALTMNLEDTPRRFCAISDKSSTPNTKNDLRTVLKLFQIIGYDARLSFVDKIDACPTETNIFLRLHSRTRVDQTLFAADLKYVNPLGAHNWLRRFEKGNATGLTGLGWISTKERTNYNAYIALNTFEADLLQHRRSFFLAFATQELYQAITLAKDITVHDKPTSILEEWVDPRLIAEMKRAGVKRSRDILPTLLLAKGWYPQHSPRNLCPKDIAASLYLNNKNVRKMQTRTQSIWIDLAIRRIAIEAREAGIGEFTCE